MPKELISKIKSTEAKRVDTISKLEETVRERINTGFETLSGREGFSKHKNPIPTINSDKNAVSLVGKFGADVLDTLIEKNVLIQKKSKSSGGSKSIGLQPTTGQASKIFTKDISSMSDMGMFLQANNIYNRRDMALYDRFNRFGILDPYNSLTGTKEYLFFTKPDLHICKPGTHELNPQLANDNFFVELAERYPQIISQLQKSVEAEKSASYSPFMAILSNTVKNTLDMPSMDAKVIDTGATIFGTSIDYRGDAFNSGEKHEFSLEFEDTKYLELYHLFRTMEEYSQLKKFGIVSPPNINNAPETDGYAYSRYIEKKELHDQFSIFKFIVDDDYQDIIYYGLLAGVMTKSTPRDAFSDINPDGGLRYNIQFEANFVDDMKPYILAAFNDLIDSTMLITESTQWLSIYNGEICDVDGRWARSPYVVKQFKDNTNVNAWLAPQSMKYKYQLRWRL